MLKMKNMLIFAVILFLGIQGLGAGDNASFVDLGFSPDGRTYIFAQYGVQSETLRPWADLFVVDVARNNFVPGGRINFVDSRPIRAGQDGSSALYHVITRNASLAQRHNVDFSLQGKPLFIVLDNTVRNNTVEFRDFENEVFYRATLVSNVQGQGAGLRSSFLINIERIARDGSRKNYTVGTPQLWRPLIESYRIRKVLISPDEGSMILVIEMKRLEGEEYSIRYMVEALRF